MNTLTASSPYSLPTLYAALTTTTPTANAAGTEITTGQYGGYQRQALVGSSWSVASSGACTYNAAIDWGAASASTGTSVVGMEFWDTLSGGVRLWWEPLTTITVSAGTHISFLSGAIVATIPILSGGVGYSTAYAKLMVEHMVGKTNFGTAPSLFLALLSTAATATTNGTELVYTGYSAGGRPLIGTSVNAASLNGTTLVDVVTNAQINFPADTGGTQTAATNFSVMDSATVGAGALVAGGTVTNGAVSSGTTPDFPSGSILFRLS